MADSAGQITCSACGASYRWKPELAGKKVKCKCGNAIGVPASSPAASAAASAPAAAPKAAPPAAKGPPPAPRRAPSPPSGASASPAGGKPSSQDDEKPENAAAVAAAQSNDGTTMLVMLLICTGCVYALVLAAREYAFFFKSTPIVVNTPAEAAKLTDNDYVQMNIELSGEYAEYEERIGNDTYGIVHFEGVKNVVLCIENPGDDPAAKVPKPLLGRLYAREDKKGYRVYGDTLNFPLIGKVLVMTTEKLSFPLTRTLVAIGSLGALGYCGFAFVRKLRGGPLLGGSAATPAEPEAEEAKS